MGSEREGSGMVGEPGAPRTPAEGLGGSGGGECDVGVLPPPRLLFPGDLLDQDVSCHPKLCSSHSEHPELLLAPCASPGAVGWAPFVVLCRNSSCQTLAMQPQGLRGSRIGAEGALEPPTSSVRGFLL